MNYEYHSRNCKKKSERRNVLGHARIACLGQLGQMAHEYQNKPTGDTVDMYVAELF